MSSYEQETLEQKLNEKYRVMADYLGNNRLKLNDDKTHLLVMTTQQKQRIMYIDVKINVSCMHCVSKNGNSNTL